jgi:NAD(P)-dependent dehydrogenase (short-subunit alcohol dehydrogenase family)
MATDWYDLSGRVALITGGNSGIGLAMATGLARAGASVAIWGTNETRNASAVESLAEAGENSAVAFTCDVSDESAVERTMSDVIERFGRLDACFANAGIGGAQTAIEHVSTDAWRRVLSVNLDGAFFTLRSAAAVLKRQGHGGTLVATASLAAVEGAARNTHYAATKGALVSMSRALAVELARNDITVNAVLPGWIETPMAAEVLASPSFREKVLPRVPLRRWGQPEDFEALAVFLAGDGSRYITGQTIVVDGGYSIF